MRRVDGHDHGHGQSHRAGPGAGGTCVGGTGDGRSMLYQRPVYRWHLCGRSRASLSVSTQVTSGLAHWVRLAEYSLRSTPASNNPRTLRRRANPHARPRAPTRSSTAHNGTLRKFHGRSRRVANGPTRMRGIYIYAARAGASMRCFVTFARARMRCFRLCSCARMQQIHWMRGESW